MRLLKFGSDGELSLTKDLIEDIPSYAILSHTWGSDDDEVTFDNLKDGSGKSKAGYAKIQFCGEQARKDGLHYIWVDTCCIDKANHAELSEAINSMFRWYHHAVKCYVYLSDVSVRDRENHKRTWKLAFRKSRWFTRGWTLQELLAPVSVEFFSREGERLGDKNTLEQQIHEITGIPIAALRGRPLSQFSVDERMRWAAKRHTRKKEDKAYCLLGIFGVYLPLIYGEGENAFIRLCQIINEDLRSNVHWVVPCASNTLFTGREDILNDLERSVRAVVQDGPGPDQCRIVITGMAGQGKSEISLKLAQRVRSFLWGVFWVDVSTPSLAENGFLDIANRLQISESTWEDGRQRLANVPRPWMLVLDNADNPDIDYQAYFPPGSFGVVMLMSRNAECKQYATADFVALEGLPTDEATQLLLKAADVAREQRPLLEDDARRVAILLQSHPLALIQAGAYIRRGHCTLAEYPRVYERQRKRLLRFRPSKAQSRYQDVYARFEASIETLQASQTQWSQDTLELLLLLAVCGPSQLPLFVFEAAWNGAQRILAGQSADEIDLRLTSWHVSRLPSLIQASEEVWDSFRLLQAVNALRAFALVSTNMADGHACVSMHPLVHAWARDRQDEQQQHESWIAMGCVMAVSHSEGDMWRVHARKLQPHLQAITSWEMGCVFRSEPRATVACILMECGWLLHDMRDDKTLFTLLDRLCSHVGLDNSTLDQRWVRLYELIGRNFLDCGKVRDAVELLKEVVRIREQTLAEHLPDRLTSQETLARAYQANGQVEDAVSLLRHVAEIREQALAKDRPDQLAGSPIEDDQSDSDLSEISSGPPSLTSDSTDASMQDKYGDAVEHLVEIFCTDENIGPIYREAAESFQTRKFHQNHDQLLKLYFRELRHEIKNRTELATTRLLRARHCRNEITSLILKSLDPFEVGKGQLTSVTLAGRKTERNYNLNQFLRSVTIVPNSYENPDKQYDGGDLPEDDASESDGSSTDAEHEFSTDKQSPLQAIDNFLTGGKAFTQLKANLASLLHPPQTLKDALRSESEFVVKQCITRILDGQPSKDKETILELRKQGISIAKIAEILLDKALAPATNIVEKNQEPALTEKTTTANAEILKHEAIDTNEHTAFSETAIMRPGLADRPKYGGSQVHNVPHLVTWTCSCGTQLHDYYTEIVPGSLEQLQQHLRSENSQSSAPWDILWNDLVAWATSRPSAAHDDPNKHSGARFENPSAQATQEITQSNTSMSATANARTPSRAQSLSISTGTFIRTQPLQPESTVSYLLLCFPEGLSGLKLHHQQILQTAAQKNLPNRVMNDKQLFQLLRKKYASERRYFMSRFWPKTVIRVSLAYFLVDLSEYVELKHYACQVGGADCRCIPPPDMIRPANNAQYHCIPREPRLKPPIGPNYLTHYFQNPHCIKSEGLVCTLNQVPKRLGQCIATSGSERVEAWGIEFEEGWDRGRLRNVVFGLITIGSLIFAILWSVMKKDMQSAFGVSGFIVGTLAIVSGYIASAEPRIVHK